MGARSEALTWCRIDMASCYFYLVLLSLMAILETCRADVCGCSPCSTYRSRHDRCECCRYIQTGRKRSSPPSFPPPQTADKRDNTKADSFSYLNFESPSSLQGKRSLWLNLPQLYNLNGGPSPPAHSQLQNSHQGSDGCIQSRSASDRNDDLSSFSKILLDDEQSQTLLRRVKDVIRTTGHNRQIDFIFPQNNQDISQDDSDVTRVREELASSKTSSIVPESRRAFGWKPVNKSVLIPEQSNVGPENMPRTELVVPDGFVAPVVDDWS